MRATGMMMPETSVHEYHGGMPAQNQVRSTRQRPGMQAEAQSLTVQTTAQNPLRQGITSPDT
jgi:hypothetical protein